MASPLPSTRLTLGLLEQVAIPSLPPTARILEVWYPLIRDDLHQRVLDLVLDLEQPAQLTHDAEHGNALLYLRWPGPSPRGLGFTVSYLVQICAPVPPGAEATEAPGPAAPPPSPGRRIVAPPEDLLAQAARLLRSVRDQARARQERVDALLDLCRRAGLPARPVAGHRVLVGSSGDGVAIAHRWMEVFVPSRGWLPGDPDCDAALGGLRCDHVARSRGRRILLQPAQQGRRLPGLFAPYGEVDGRRVEVRSRIRATVRSDPPLVVRPPAPGRPPSMVEVLGDDRELDLLHPPPRRLRLGPGASLVEDRPASDWLFVVLRGRIRLSRLTGSGHRLELESIAAPGVFTGTRLGGGLAEAAEETELRVLSRAQVEQLARRWPHLAVELVEVLSRRLTEAEERLEYQAYHSAADRLALALLRHRRPEDGLLEDVTHQELGDMIGASRETVTKLLHSLPFRGAVTVRPRRIRVTDPAALVELLEG
jgi:CRP/FNR family cyclic AMP-dependent transcriptional regulator